MPEKSTLRIGHQILMMTWLIVKENYQGKQFDLLFLDVFR